MANVLRHAWQALSNGLAWLWVLMALVPFLFMLTTSLKPRGAAQAVPPQWIFTPTFEHYTTVLGGATSASQAILPLLFHSAVVATATTILTLGVGLPAAYALTLPKFRARRFLSKWILSTLMFPPVVAVIPVFILAGQLNLTDTYPVLVVPYTAFNLPIVIWILRSSILQVPKEVEEAAFVDGCNQFQLLYRVILPLVATGLATAGILCVILSWNEYLFALVLTRADVKTAPIGVNEFTGMFGTDWGSLTAAAVAIVAPIVVMTIALRRHMVEGLTLGAVK